MTSRPSITSVRRATKASLPVLLVSGLLLLGACGSKGSSSDTTAAAAVETTAAAATETTAAATETTSAATETTAAAATETTAAAATDTTATAAAGAGATASPVGTWNIGTGSSAGYRVNEEFTVGGKKTAVGRTSGVTGTVVVTEAAGGFSAVADVTVDMSSLASDSSRRDGQIKQRGIQTDTFPTATFVSEPIAIAASAVDGRVDVTAKGKLTLHGVTKDIELPIAAQISNGQLQILGKAPIVMADYDIEPPTISGIVTVEDKGEFEFLLITTKA